MNGKSTALEATSPFHSGEQAVQSRLGVRDIEHWARKVVRDFLPQQHREFYCAQPFLVVAARDEGDRPWVTLLHGQPGFVSSPDSRRLRINAVPAAGDALEHGLREGADFGVLGIEPATRRRNRVNGRIGSTEEGNFELLVEQAYGNCPQYIHERNIHLVKQNRPVSAQRSHRLTAKQREWIVAADTFFIGTGYRGEGESETFGMDASHRGGEPGFVELMGDELRFPDYAGNNHFNTIGNLSLDSQVGMLFVDFENGSMLQLTGNATIEWEPGQADLAKGVRRLISVRIDQIVELTNALPMRWQSETSSVRSLRLIDKVAESRDVTSFVFEAQDGAPLTGFEPGQHLPIELSIPGIEQPVRRTYSLSSSPADAQYRITVKRAAMGLASRHLHDTIEPGTIVKSRKPAGDFLMTCNLCPLVLVSAGVGVTPMISILRAVTAQTGDRPVWFIHGARDGDHHPLAEEVRAIVAEHSNINLSVAYSNPRPEDVPGTDYHHRGRVDGSLLSSLVSRPDAHYFLCGPSRFMADLEAELEQNAVPIEQIHYETFGPAA